MYDVRHQPDAGLLRGNFKCKEREMNQFLLKWRLSLQKIICKQIATYGRLDKSLNCIASQKICLNFHPFFSQRGYNSIEALVILYQQHVNYIKANTY